MAGLTGLEYLNLRGNRSFTDITPLAGLTELTHLDLYQNHIGRSSTGLAPLAGLTNLEWLAVGANGLNGKIGPLAGLKKLKVLRINAFGLQNSGLETLAHNLKNLIHLNLSGNGGITDYSPLTCLLPHLKWLDLRSMDDREPPLWVIDADADEDVTGPDLKVVNEKDWPILQFLVDSGVTIAWS